MLDPYKGFSTAQSAQAGIAAGNVAADSRSKRAALAQQKELALADDARAGQYLDLQKQQTAFGQKQDLNDRRMKAYAGFQAAVDAGDTEGADLAANQLRMLGVDVQQYGGEKAGTVPSAKPPAAPSASPTEAVAQAQAPRAPMNAKDAKLDKDLDALARSATVDSGDPMQAVAAASVPRPTPARAVPVQTPGKATPGSYEAAMEAAAKMGTPTSWAEQVGPDQWEARGGDENGNPIPEPGSILDQYNDQRAGRATHKSNVNGQMIDVETGSLVDRYEKQMAAERGRPRPAPAREQYVKGQEPAPAGQATPQQGLIRGYRLNFDGQTIDIDPQSVQERQRQRVANSLAPLLRNASTPEEQRAAATAIQAAVESVGTLKPNEAIEYGLGLYKDPLDRGAKEKRARIVSSKGEPGAGPLGKVPFQQQSTLADDVDLLIERVQNQNTVKQTRDQLENGKKIAGMLSSNNPVAQVGAQAATIKQFYSAASSDRELMTVLNAGGKWTQFEREYNNWVNTGKMPDSFRKSLAEVASIANKYAREKIARVGRHAGHRVRTNPFLKSRMTPEQLEEAGRYAEDSILGTDDAAQEAAPKGKTRSALTAVQNAPRPKPGAPAAEPQPKSTAQARADALKKRLMGK